MGREGLRISMLRHVRYFECRAISLASLVIAPTFIYGSVMRMRNLLSTTIWRAVLLVICLTPALCVAAQKAYRVKDVPPISKGEGRYVIDPQGIMTEEEQRRLTEKIITVRDSTDIEIAVVLLPDYDRDKYESNRHFGNELFNTWRLGHSRTNKGLLILFITKPDGRQFSLEIGDGLGYTLTDAQSILVQRKVMRPLLKQDRYYDGIVAGIDAVVDIDYGREVSSKKEENVGPPPELTAWDYFWVVGLPLILALIYYSFQLYSEKLQLKNLGWIYELYLPKTTKGMWICLICLPTIPIFALFLVLRRILARRMLKDIVCPHCQAVNKIKKAPLGYTSKTERELFEDDTYKAKTSYKASVMCKACGAVWYLWATQRASGKIPNYYSDRDREAFRLGEDWRISSSSGSSDSWGGDSGGSSSGGGSSSDY